MNLYLVQRKESCSGDKYDYATYIISANTKEQAIKLAKSDWSELVTLEDFSAKILEPTKTARQHFQFQNRKIARLF
jgi:hypothetical protein